MENANTSVYINKLQQFVDTINSRVNRSIRRRPKDVQNQDVLAVSYSKPILDRKKPKYKVGDLVRISKYNIPFRKGYKPQYTNEVFTIGKVYMTSPPTYEIIDNNGEPIMGKFYQQELVLFIQ